MRILSRLLSWLQKGWAGLHTVYFFFKPIRFVVIPLALLLYALIVSDQGQDSIRFLVELDPRCPHYGRIAVFLVFTTLAALQVWYWARQVLRIRSVAATSESYPKSEIWTPRFLGVSVFLIALGALGRAAYLAWSGTFRDSTLRVILITSGLLVVLLALFLAGVIWRRRWLGAYTRVATHADLDPKTLLILRGTVLLGALFTVLTAVSPLTAGRWLQSPSLLMLSALLWVGLGSFLAYAFDARRIPLATTFLLLAIFFSFFNDNHAVRTLAGALPERRPIDQTFASWYARLEAKYPQPPELPVFVVATEGGGIRAGYWTAAVLSALEDQAPQFSDHLFAISSVSGGSLGATVFTALVADDARTGVVDSCGRKQGRSFRLAARQILAYDFLAPTLASLLHADFVQRFLPVGFIPDRGKALETGWETAWRTVLLTTGEPDDFLSRGMLDLYAKRQDALLPSLFLNGTSVEAGNRLIASNCDLTGGQIPEAGDLFAHLGRDMRLSTAAHNSARFTYVSPAGAVHDKGGKLREHVVDGGYFEDSGAATAADVIATILSQAGQPQAGHRPFAVHLIRIKFQEIDSRGCTPLELPGPRPNRFLNEILSPLDAILATRDARARLAYAEAGKLPQVQVHEFILTQNRHGLRMPLGWLLSERTRNAIDLQIGSEENPEGLDCALRSAVEKNRTQLLVIASMLNPAPAKPDAAQLEANESEKQAKQ